MFTKVVQAKRGSGTNDMCDWWLRDYSYFLIMNVKRTIRATYKRQAEPDRWRVFVTVT